MIWGGRTDCIVEDMTYLVGMPLSLAGFPVGLSLWYSIQSNSKIVMLKIIGEKRQNNMSDQRNSREALKIWRLVQF